MKLKQVLISSAFGMSLLCAQQPAAKPAPGRVTADQQGESKSDLRLTQTIRRSLMKDRSLSVYAHNVTIISRDGSVTLRGAVKSDDERRSVVAKAEEAAGSGDKVMDQLTVKQ